MIFEYAICNNEIATRIICTFNEQDFFYNDA